MWTSIHVVQLNSLMILFFNELLSTSIVVAHIEVDRRDLVSLLSFILRSREAVKW